MKRLPAPVLLALALVLVLTLAPRPVPGATCGPDTYGYTWRDDLSGATALDIPFVNPVEIAVPSGNEPPVQVTLPFPFSFYGESYTEIYLSGFRWASFLDYGWSDLFALCFPTSADPNALIAPFWSHDPRADTMRYEYFPCPGAFKVEWTGTLSDDTTTYRVAMILFADGRIQFEYPEYSGDEGRLDFVYIGVEDEFGSKGLPAKCGDTNNCGFLPSPLAGKVVEYSSIPKLDCALPQPIACGQTITMDGAGLVDPNVEQYSCSPGLVYEGNERVAVFDLADASTVAANLSNMGAADLDIFLVNSCHEADCSTFGDVSLASGILLPGTYYLVVDGPFPSDTITPVDVRLNCRSMSTAIACDQTVPGDTVTGLNLIQDPPCAGGKALDGPEILHQLTVASTTNLAISLTSASDLDLLFLECPESGGCAAWGDDSLRLWNVEPGTYWIAVDGDLGEEGRFDLTVNCGSGLDCGSPVALLSCGDSASGNTATGPNNVEQYGCAPGADYSGGELVYEIDVSAPQDVTLRLWNPAPGLEFFILSECNEANCTPGGHFARCEKDMPFGRYYVVVDGLDGAEGFFDLQMVCGSLDPPATPFSEWLICEPDSPGPSADLSRWDFDSGFYCGTGCDFAMYVAVDCGTEFHIPLWDVESGDIAIYSLLDGEYMDLTATGTGGFFDTTDVGAGDNRITWVSEGCPDENLADDDPIFNEQSMDIRFDGFPTVCGVYRMEFYNWGGYVWELYANCTGQTDPGFRIFDSECDAINAFSPAAELTLSDLVVDESACPDVEIQVEVTNVGCVPTPISPIRLRSDTGEQVDTDGGPLAPGDTRLVTIPISLSAEPATLTLEVDPSITPGDDGLVQECSEGGGSLVACGLAGGARIFQVPACANCAVEISGPDAGCQDDDLCFDATPTDGVAPFEFRWDMDGDTVPEEVGPAATYCHAYPDWGSYTVELWMTDSSSCTTFVQKPVEVEPDPVPPAVSETLLLSKSGVADLKFNWVNLSPGIPIDEYLVVGVAHNGADPPDQDRMDNQSTVYARSRDGRPGAVEPDGLASPDRLRYYKVRADSLCSKTPGPTKN